MDAEPATETPQSQAPEHVLLLGGAGFVGSNLCRRLLAAGAQVTIFDDLSRAGAALNLAALRAQPDAGSRLAFMDGDIRKPEAVAAAVRGQQAVYHLAAQVAVTQSLANPRRDFEINALGTLNVLEAVRAQPSPPFLLFCSTNKVYGALDGAMPAGGAVSEQQPLDFHSPYGCSKGAADQYVRDYARIFRLPAVVFRMSCIYGPGQHGNEDQGWVAHFARAGLLQQPIVVYGDGEQARDLLFVDDLTDAMLRAWRKRAACAGQVFNIGGGLASLRSLRQVIDELGALWRRPLRVAYGPSRPGDQRYYCTDYRRFQAATEWSPQTAVSEGLQRLCGWLEQSLGRSAWAAAPAKRGAG